MDALKKQGLVLTGTLDPETAKLYEELGRKALRAELTGKLFSRQLLERVEAALAERRGTHGGKTKKG